MTRKKIAVITGGSSGLGKEFIKTILQRYPELDEIWALARRNVNGEIFSSMKIISYSIDLTSQEQRQMFAEKLEAERPLIKVLVNNAGYLKSGYFTDVSAASILNTVRLNIEALTHLQYICLPYMERGSFAVLTCSAVSFAPIVGQAVYSASKKYVYYFGRALREELLPRGINILVLCAGNMDTEMNPKEKAHKVSSVLPFLDMSELTRNALEQAEKGVGVYTMGWRYKALRLVGKMLPSWAVMKITKKFFP